MQNIAISLNAEQQTAHARWAVMKSMVGDAIETRARSMFYTSEERYAMRETGTIPDNTRVWLGSYSRSTLYIDGNDIGLDMHAGNEIPELVNSCLHTIVVGYLVIQVFTIHVPEKYKGRPFEIKTVTEEPWDDILVTFRPVNRSTISWPPRLFLKNTGIQRLAQRFSGGIRL